MELSGPFQLLWMFRKRKYVTTPTTLQPSITCRPKQSLPRVSLACSFYVMLMLILLVVALLLL
jgi:hypothetical protein